MHVACAQQRWPLEAARYFLLSIEPEMGGRRPAELVRESDEHAHSVVQVIVRRPVPVAVDVDEAASGEPGGNEMSASQSPVAQLVAETPGDDDLLERTYRTPALVGRVRPIGGMQEQVDPFRVHYTAATSHADQRLVVDGTYRLYFEKSLLPDEQATQLLDDERRRLFVAWIGRRSSRAAFPNDFVATVGRTIDWVWRKKRFANSPVSTRLYQWRVGIYGAGDDHVDFVIPYDERTTDEATVKQFVEDFFDEVRQRLPTQAEKAREHEQARRSNAEIREYTISNVEVRSAKQISMRLMLDMPPFNLEHLTYAADTVVGAESRVEPEG